MKIDEMHVDDHNEKNNILTATNITASNVCLQNED